jgi:hypothetical protein
VGSWEILNSVLVGILHVDVTTVAWSLGLRNLQLPQYSRILPVAGMPYDHARNSVCETALKEGFQWVLMLDSDVIPPNDAVLRLLRHNLPVVSGLYCRRSPPCAIPVMIKDGQWVTKFPANALIEVDYVGAGCLLINRSVLEKLPPPAGHPGKRWFHWKVDARGHEDTAGCLSEDFVFNRRCKLELGIPTMVDTSIVCRHVGSAQATIGRFEPCDTNPVT